MLSPQDKKDKLIRATDIDALSCRFSANKQSYLNDPYIDSLLSSYQSHLQYCSGYTNLSAGRTLRSALGERKLPLINRGTYFRTKLIDLVVEEFVSEFKKCQIISLGGGSDTRGIKLIEKEKEVTYHEIDFPESAKIKKLAILNNPKLFKLVCETNFQSDIEPSESGLSLISESLSTEIESKEQFSKINPDFHSERYHLHGYDLRKLTDKDDLTNFQHLLKWVDSSIPTLVLSECVLCYLSPNENENIIKFWKMWNTSLISFLVYEPMSLNDAFGSTMTKNLSYRGLDLQTFDEFPSLNARFEFLTSKCGLINTKLTDMSDVGGYNNKGGLLHKPWIDTKELQRINRLEMIDEVEEIRLLLEHYCLSYGESSVDKEITFKGIDKWRWLLT